MRERQVLWSQLHHAPAVGCVTTVPSTGLPFVALRDRASTGLHSVARGGIAEVPSTGMPSAALRDRSFTQAQRKPGRVFVALGDR